MKFNPAYIFQRDGRNQGVRRIKIYVLQIIYTLMFFMLGQTVWTHIFDHTGRWEADDAMAWSVWAGFSLLAGLGIIHPLKMLPIILLEIFYKGLWLVLVAYPLWSSGTLAGSQDEYQSHLFSGIIVPIVAVPWLYVFRNFVAISPKPAT